MTALFFFWFNQTSNFIYRNIIEKPKYPDITIQLTGEDGNAFFILGKVHKAMVKAGLRKEYAAFEEEATSSDYNHLLATVMRWFTTE